MFPTCIGIVASAMLLGIDGTAIFTPCMILLFPLLKVPFISPIVAVTVGLLTEFFGFISGLIGYRDKRLIDFEVGWTLVAVGVPVIVSFSLIAQFVTGFLLKLIFGVMMVSIAVYLGVTAKTSVRNKHAPRTDSHGPVGQGRQPERAIISRSSINDRYPGFDNKMGLLISGIGSALEGMLSVGLGELLMPDLVRRCKIPVAIAAATSVFVMTLTVFAGSITDLVALFVRGGLDAIPWNLLIYTIPGAMLGGQVGAKLQGRLSSTKVE